jgi:hypothetical protein
MAIGKLRMALPGPHAKKKARAPSKTTTVKGQNDVQERLSHSYLTTVAARAGYQIAKFDIDKSSNDAMVAPNSGSNRLLKFQHKATTANIISGSEVFFDVTRKNYDDLRDKDVTVPHYLMVLHLPGPIGDWLEVRPDDMILRATAYWANLCGLPASANLTTQRIYLPDTQRLTVKQITALMKAAPLQLGTAKVKQ